MQETGVQCLGSEDPLEKGMTTCSTFLPGESHGQRSLAGYSLWGPQGMGHNRATEQHFHFHLLPQINPVGESHPGIQSILLHCLPDLVHSLHKNVQAKSTNPDVSIKTCPKPGKTFLIPCKCYQARPHCLTYLEANTMVLDLGKRKSLTLKSAGKKTGGRIQFYLPHSGLGVKDKGLEEIHTWKLISAYKLLLVLEGRFFLLEELTAHFMKGFCGDLSILSVP